MTEERQNRILEIRWELERKKLLSDLIPHLNSLLTPDSFDFLTFEDSDSFQSDDWPKNKWDEKLYIQTEISDVEPIESVLRIFLDLIEGNHVYLFLMHYNFGLIRISKDELIRNWVRLIDLDKDEIYCYNPDTPDFICIEKTEEFISGQAKKGPKWIYELTFSSKELKEKINSSNSNDKTDYLVILASTLDDPELRDEAISELNAIGISEKEIEERYKSLDSDDAQMRAFDKYNAAQSDDNELESYTVLQMVNVFLFGPYNLFKFFDSGLAELKGDNYKLKYRQRIFLLIGGTLFWIMVMLLIFKYQVLKD